LDGKPVVSSLLPNDLNDSVSSLAVTAYLAVPSQNRGPQASLCLYRSKSPVEHHAIWFEMSH
jgi:hypothetical protein